MTWVLVQAMESGVSLYLSYSYAGPPWLAPGLWLRIVHARGLEDFEDLYDHLQTITFEGMQQTLYKKEMETWVRTSNFCLVQPRSSPLLWTGSRSRLNKGVWFEGRSLWVVKSPKTTLGLPTSELDAIIWTALSWCQGVDQSPPENCRKPWPRQTSWKWISMELLWSDETQILYFEQWNKIVFKP